MIAAGYVGSFYWSSYLRALGKAADDSQNGCPDRALQRLKSVVALPPVGKLVDHWALCRNFQAYLHIKLNQLDLAEESLDAIRQRSGVTRGVRGLGYFRSAELYDKNGLSQQAEAFREQALEVFQSETEALGRQKLWRPIVLILYGTGYYRLAVKAIDELLKIDRSPSLLYLRACCLERSGANRKISLAACREALQHADSPVRRASLLSSACTLEVKDRPESALEAGRVCLELQEKLGRAADSDVTKMAHFGRLCAWARLGKENEFLVEKKLLTSLLCLSRVTDVLILGSIHYLEGAFVEWLKLSEQHRHEPLFFHHRARFLEKLGRPSEALHYYSVGGSTHSADQARCRLALFQRREIEPLINPMMERDAVACRALLSEMAYVWDGDPVLGAELWPHSQPGGIRLRYEGLFEESTEALQAELDETCFSPRFSETQKKLLEATNWLLMERWHQALVHFESLIGEFRQNPVLKDYCLLFALCCRCRLAEDALAPLRAQASRTKERFPDYPLLHADATLLLAQGYFGSHRFEQLLPLLCEALLVEPRAFHKAQLLDIRSQAHRHLENWALAEADDKALLRLVPESYLSLRARTRLELP